MRELTDQEGLTIILISMFALIGCAIVSATTYEIAKTLVSCP